MIAVLTDADWLRAGLGRPAGRGDAAEAARRLADRTSRPIRRWRAASCAGSAIPSRSWSRRRRPRRADAAELIEVDYEPLPAVIDTEAALAPGAPLVWPDAANNICYVWQGGDKAAADAAFAKADRVIKYKAVVNRVTAATMEPRASLAHFDPAADRYHRLHDAAARVRLSRADRRDDRACRRARSASSPPTSAAASA